MSDVVGLDIGGSKTAGVRRRAGREVARARTGSANLQSVSVEQARAALQDLAARLGSDGVQVVYAAAAGADTTASQRRVADLVAAAWPAAQVRVGHDTTALLPAAGLDAGIAVVSGTGSVAVGVGRDGRTARAGGWGYLLGDEGSGYGLARDAIRHTLARADAGMPPDRVSALVLYRAGVADPLEVVAVVYARPERRYWADLAGPLVDLAARDAAAATIVDTGSAALAGLATTVAQRLGEWLPVLLAGGLPVHHPGWARLVGGRVVAAGAPAVTVLAAEPVDGAAVLAQRLVR